VTQLRNLSTWSAGGELQFSGDFRKPVTVPLVLFNSFPESVDFRLKTTRPHRYLVR
jgi:hypothetical protein